MGYGTKGLRDYQDEVRKWADGNFGDVPSWQSLLGVGEELGELNHAHLKRDQGIRGTAAEHRAAQVDAVGDILIYLLDYCSREGIDLQDALRHTWETVSRRDWKASPRDGVVPA